ncbi:MAG: universal stress protein [Cyclobacteriaceae bacterium]
MTTILFPTDFSDRANKGLVQVAGLALRSKSKLIVYHAYNRPYSETGALEHVDKLLKNVERLIDGKFKSYLKQIDDLKSIQCEFVKELGMFTEGLINVAKKKKVDLVAMPTKGAKGLGMIWGTKTATIVKELNIPVLVIPDNTNLEDIKKTGLVCDYSNQTDYHTLDLLRCIAEALGLYVDVVTLNRNEKEMTHEDKAYRQIVRKKLEGISTSFSFTFHSYVDDGIIDYAKENDIGMITILPKNYDFLDSIFHESFTEQMTYLSPLPLLILK